MTLEGLLKQVVLRLERKDSATSTTDFQLLMADFDACCKRQQPFALVKMNGFLMAVFKTPSDCDHEIKEREASTHPSHTAYSQPHLWNDGDHSFSGSEHEHTFSVPTRLSPHMGMSARVQATNFKSMDHFHQRSSTPLNVEHWTSQHPDMSMSTTSSQKKRARVEYTKEEVIALERGVKEYGPNFKAILKANRAIFHPKRTATNLYDKYRQSRSFV